MFPAVAGVQPETSRSIKPRERDLGDLRLFFLVRILTRPTNHPRHAACASNYESKPVRPHLIGKQSYSHRTLDATACTLARASKPQIPGPPLLDGLAVASSKPQAIYQNPKLQEE